MTKFLRFKLDLCRIDCASGTSKQSDIFNAIIVHWIVFEMSQIRPLKGSRLIQRAERSMGMGCLDVPVSMVTGLRCAPGWVANRAISFWPRSFHSRFKSPAPSRSKNMSSQPRPYSLEELLALRESPLVTKPESLPQMEQWMHSPIDRRSLPNSQAQ
jgi:hypothetical protein